MIHIGQLIKQKVKERNKTSVWLAEQLAYSRTNLYKLYDKKSIDTDVLFRVSVILDFDFFNLYSENIRIREEERAAREKQLSPKQHPNP